jgi:hypothetical protein
LWDNLSVYIFNISRLQYEDNKGDKHDGFYILRKIDLNNISNEQQNYLRQIGAADIRTSRRMDDEFRGWRNNGESSGVYSTGAATAMEADGVDIETDGDSQSRRGRDTGTGFENEQEEIKCITKAIMKNTKFVLMA